MLNAEMECGGITLIPFGKKIYNLLQFKDL
jgi:hypothetical protein